MWLKLVLTAVLFYVFVPGVVVRLSTPFTSPEVTHAILFAILSKFVWQAMKTVTKA